MTQSSRCFVENCDRIRGVAYVMAQNIPWYVAKRISGMAPAGAPRTLRKPMCSRFPMKAFAFLLKASEYPQKNHYHVLANVLLETKRWGSPERTYLETGDGGGHHCKPNERES